MKQTLIMKRHETYLLNYPFLQLQDITTTYKVIYEQCGHRDIPIKKENKN